jgi:hypothetical protein
MATDRQQLIAQKLSAARQRQMRDAYVRSLPDPIRDELATAPVLYEPDNQRIRFLAGVSASGLGRDEPLVPPGFVFREFSWPEQVFAALAGCGDGHDTEPAHFQPFTVRAVTDDLWNREAPAFGVTFGWARRHLSALFHATVHGFALATDSFGAGIVVSVVCGYLPEDPNPDEGIYEVAVWG